MIGERGVLALAEWFLFSSSFISLCIGGVALFLTISFSLYLCKLPGWWECVQGWRTRHLRAGKGEGWARVETVPDVNPERHDLSTLLLEGTPRAPSNGRRGR